ncbi:MAG: heavy-metal-associated domain-containing protein [Bacteroidota bacterium]|nr:heavy-metal-associated domain-containing protein [Bacteroidota bacterium]MDP4206565.1 heavy-metal-associated domain-containing protein [Bacteroidota bacterium]
MKRLMLIMTVILLAAGLNLSAGTVKKASFKVNGNCGMCKTRIEKAAKSVTGVTTADWNQSTKVLAVSYNEAKTNSDQIQKAIAKVGHDTEKFKADDKTYNALPGCCKYRPKAK